jgi:hypothetical protein
MKLGKYGIVGIVLWMLICVSFTVSATSFSDPTGDVKYGSASDYYGEVNNKPNLDITYLSYVVNGNSITINLTVLGLIQFSEDVEYSAYVNSTDTEYIMILNNQHRIGASMNRISGVREYSNGSITVSGDTLSGIFTLGSNSLMITIYGYAREGILTQNGPTGDLWVDNAKYTYLSNSTNTDGNITNNTGKNNINNSGANTNDTTGNNTDNNTTSPGEKTPGFELLLVIAAVTITAIFLRRQR